MRERLLSTLPEYTGTTILVNPDQDTADIIQEIKAAHEYFSQDYDCIYNFFLTDDLRKLCRSLFDFCKQHIRYKIEPEDAQTTKSPAAIIAQGYGDCKHYAGFIGGVLDAITRATGRKINWCYRFASYRMLSDTPEHVFVVVKDHGTEIWIDPVLRSFDERLVPYYIHDEKVKPMLSRVSGIGKASLTVHANTNDSMINYDGTGRYNGVFAPWLGLSEYRDFGGDREINEAAVANEINAAIANGPAPGHAVTPDFVKWVYDENIRSWNFYYPGGVEPGFEASAILPASYPRPILTPDGRLIFDKDVKLDDYRNAEIHVLTAWVQDLVNTWDDSPYPVKPRHLKQFSQDFNGRMASDGDLFVEARGKSWIKELGKTINTVINKVKDGVFKIVGSIPRNAFLSLVGINAFNLATGLWKKIQSGGSDQLKKAWESFGGRYDKLYNTIENAHTKHRIGVAPAAAPAAAWIAAAAPILAIMLKFIDKDGSTTQVLSAIKGAVEVAFPDVVLDGFDFLDRNTGMPVQWEIAPGDNENMGGGNNDMPGSGALGFLGRNPVMVAAITAAGLYFVVTPKARRKKPKAMDIVLPLAGGAGVYFLLNKTVGNKSGLSVSAMREELRVSNNGEMASVMDMFTDSEIPVLYNFYKNYTSKGLPPPAALLQQVVTIFTNHGLQST